MDKRLKLGIFLLLSAVISIAFTFVVFQTRFGNVQAQQTTTCQVGAYCCSLNDTNICGWIVFRNNDFLACSDRAGTTNCQVMPGGAAFSCPVAGTACTGGLFCSTQTQNAVVEQCADGNCRAQEFVRQQCSAVTACQNGVCIPNTQPPTPTATSAAQITPQPGSSLPWGYTPYRPQFGDLLKQLAFIAPLFLAIYWLF